MDKQNEIIWLQEQILNGRQKMTFFFSNKYQLAGFDSHKVDQRLDQTMPQCSKLHMNANRKCQKCHM